MASGQGTAIIDFGAAPGSNEASIAVSDASVSGTSKAEAYIMADDTSVDHTANDHRYVINWLRPVCGTPSAGVGFMIYGYSTEKLAGKFTLRYVWAD